MKTIFLDIDGTIFHQSDRCADMYNTQPTLIKGSAKKCWEWHLKGYNIILTTGRPEPARGRTEAALAHHNITYDQLVMGLGPGPRVLINNVNEVGTIDGVCEMMGLTASAIEVETNEGISDLNI